MNDENELGYSATLDTDDITEKAEQLADIFNDLSDKAAKTGKSFDAAGKEFDDLAKSAGLTAEQTAKLKEAGDLLAKTMRNLSDEEGGAKKETKELTKEEKEARDAVLELAAAMDGRLVNAMNTVKGLLGVMGLLQFGQACIGAQASVDALQASFKTLTGSASEGKAVFAQLQEIANTTGLDFGVLADGTKQMMSFGLSAQKAIPAMKAIGEIAGGDKAKISSLALAFSQASSAGKLASNDLMQMVNAGFNPLNEIAKKTGESVAKLKDEGISAERMAEAFQMAVQEGGTFYGNMSAQMDTYAGAQTRLNTAVEEMERGLGKLLIGPATTAANLVTFICKQFRILIPLLAGVAAAYGVLNAALAIRNNLEKQNLAFNMTNVFKSMITSLKELIVAQKAWNAAASANPYVLIASAIIGVATAIAGLSLLYEDDEEATENFTGATAELERETTLAKDALNEESDAMRKATNTAKDLETALRKTKVGTEEQKKAWKALTDELPELANKYKTVEEFLSDKHSKDDVAQKAQKKFLENRKTELNKTKEDALAANKALEEEAKAFKQALDAGLVSYSASTARNEDGSRKPAMAFLTEDGAKALNTGNLKGFNIAKVKEYDNLLSLNAAIEDNERQHNRILATEQDEFNKKALDKAKQAREKAKAKAKSDLEARKRILEEDAKLNRKAVLDMEQARIDSMDEGIEKSLAQVDQNYERKIAQLKEEEIRISRQNRKVKMTGLNSNGLTEAQQNDMDLKKRAAELTWTKQHRAEIEKYENDDKYYTNYDKLTKLEKSRAESVKAIDNSYGSAYQKMQRISKVNKDIKKQEDGILEDIFNELESSDKIRSTWEDMELEDLEVTLQGIASQYDEIALNAEAISEADQTTLTNLKAQQTVLTKIIKDKKKQKDDEKKSKKSGKEQFAEGLEGLFGDTQSVASTVGTALQQVNDIISRDWKEMSKLEKRQSVMSSVASVADSIPVYGQLISAVIGGVQLVDTITDKMSDSVRKESREMEKAMKYTSGYAEALNALTNAKNALLEGGGLNFIDDTANENIDKYAKQLSNAMYTKNVQKGILDTYIQLDIATKYQEWIDDAQAKAKKGSVNSPMAWANGGLVGEIASSYKKKWSSKAYNLEQQKAMALAVTKQQLADATGAIEAIWSTDGFNLKTYLKSLGATDDDIYTKDVLGNKQINWDFVMSITNTEDFKSKFGETSQAVIASYAEAATTVESILEHIVTNIKSQIGDLGSSLANQLVTALAQGENASKKFADTLHDEVRKAMINLVSDTVMTNTIKPVLEKMYKELTPVLGLYDEQTGQVIESNASFLEKYKAQLDTANSLQAKGASSFAQKLTLGGKTTADVQKEAQDFINQSGLAQLGVTYEQFANASIEQLATWGDALQSLQAGAVISKYQNELNQAEIGAESLAKTMLEAMGVTAETGQTQTAGALSSVTQESIDELLGRLTAIQGYTYNIRENSTVIYGTLTNIRDYMLGTLDNRLTNMENVLAHIHVHGVKVVS